jgi:protein-disulfide isomerase/uncharacterized membrane protein
MIRSWRLSVALALALAGAWLSGVLLMQHHGERAGAAFVSATCGADEHSGCEAVKRSPYSQVRGIPLAACGLFFYASLALLVLLALAAGPGGRETGVALAWLLALLGVLVDLALLGVQAFLVHAFCNVCLLSYAAGVGALLLLWPAWRHLRSLAASLRAAEPRVLLAGWVLGTLGLAGAALTLETALDAREIARPVAFTEKQVETLSPQEARAEVQRLRATLDDPAKLEQYFAQKAVRDFEKAPVQNLDLSDAPTAGVPGAPIRAVVYSDFLCPWCRQLALWLEQVAPQFRDRLAVSFRNYPLDKSCNTDLPRTVHEGACPLALGAECAAEQGRFWQYHSSAFQQTLEKATPDDVRRIAAMSGLDMPRFARCLASEAPGLRLARDIQEARRVGVNATPTVLINGKRLARVTDLPLIVQVESARLGLPMPTPATPR